MTTVKLMQKATMLLIEINNGLSIEVEFEKALKESGWTKKTTNPSEVKSDLKGIIINIQGLEDDIQNFEDNLLDMKNDLIAAINSIEE